VKFLLVEQSNPSSAVVQSEISVEDPLLLMEQYTQALLLSLTWKPQPKRVYVAGLGGARLPLLLHHYLRDVHIDCTDIDPDVIRIAQQYFGLQIDERVHVKIEDGRKWLETNDTIYDIILLDVFLDNGYSPYKMTTVEFFLLCRNRLASNGIVAINVLSDDKFITAKAHTLAEVFPYTYSYVELNGNIVLFGATAEVTLDQLQERAAKLDAIYAFPFPFREIGTQVRAGLGDLDNQVAKAQTLTDADPPLEYFDNLPSFDSPFSRVAPDLPCPCGSGLRFADCHGRTSDSSAG
jgi:spermidine synthase